jgi:hypothetical protein
VVALRNRGLRSLSWARFGPLFDVHLGRRTPFYRSVSMEFRPHGQRETVLSGFVELST